jgi:hypothetical protein
VCVCDPTVNFVVAKQLLFFFLRPFPPLAQPGPLLPG